jgi:hypothetical protein
MYALVQRTAFSSEKMATQTAGCQRQAPASKQWPVTRLGATTEDPAHTKFGSSKLTFKFKLKIRPEMSSRYRICTKISLTYRTSIESVQAQLQRRAEM